MILLITYDLKGQRLDYVQLIAQIKKAKNWWHYLKSSWLIKTDRAPDWWIEKLTPFLGEDDRILIIEVKNNYNGSLPEKAWSWIQTNLD